MRQGSHVQLSSLCYWLNSLHFIYLNVFWYCASLIAGGNDDLMLCLKSFHFFFNPISGNSRPTDRVGRLGFGCSVGSGSGELCQLTPTAPRHHWKASHAAVPGGLTSPFHKPSKLSLGYKSHGLCQLKRKILQGCLLFLVWNEWFLSFFHRFFKELEARHQNNIFIDDISDIVEKHTSSTFDPYVKYCTNEVYQQRTLQKLL